MPHVLSKPLTSKIVQTALKLDTKREGVDAFLTPLGRALPTVVIQSCWEEDYEDTLKDTSRYLGEGKGAIHKVFLLRWKADGDQTVGCKLEVYTYHGRYNYKARPAKPNYEYVSDKILYYKVHQLIEASRMFCR